MLKLPWSSLVNYQGCKVMICCRWKRNKQSEEQQPQISNLNYMGCVTSYEKYITKKNHKIYTNFSNNKQYLETWTNWKMYNTLVLLTLLYDSEIWTIKEKDISILRTTEKKFFRTAGYALLEMKKEIMKFRRARSKINWKQISKIHMYSSPTKEVPAQNPFFLHAHNLL